jgi:hypothetical protein
LYASPNITGVIKSGRVRWAGHVTRVGARKTYNILVGKPDGKRPLGRPRRRWEDNIRMDLGKVGWEGADWVHLAQDTEQWRAVLNVVTKLWVS